jgi:hypothetical protein
MKFEEEVRGCKYVESWNCRVWDVNICTQLLIRADSVSAPDLHSFMFGLSYLNLCRAESIAGSEVSGEGRCAREQERGGMVPSQPGLEVDSSTFTLTLPLCYDSSH